MVSGPVFPVLVLTFTFRSFSIPSTSLGNGIPSSFGHLHSRCQVFSLICSNVTVMGLHQRSGVVGNWDGSGGTDGSYGLVGVGLGLIVGVGDPMSCSLMVVGCK